MLENRSVDVLLVVVIALSTLPLPVLAEEAKDGCDADLSVSMDRAIFGMAFSAAPRGWLVGLVAAGEPAAVAGLRPGDLLVAIDGFAPIFADNLEALRWADRLKAGRAVEMEVSRGNKAFSLSLVGRPPTCAEARKLSDRLAGGPPILGTEPCGSSTEAACEDEEAGGGTTGWVASDGYLRLLALADEQGDLTLRVRGRSEDFRVEIVDPAGLPDRISLDQLSPEVREVTEKLRGADSAVFRIEMFPPEGKERYRHAVRWLALPDYAH